MLASLDKFVNKLYNKENSYFNSTRMGKFKNEKPNMFKKNTIKIAIPALIIFNLAIFSFLLFEGAGFIWTLSKEKIALSVHSEQKEYQDKLSELIDSIENQTNSLDAEYKNLFDKNRIELEDKQKTLGKIEELEKDSQRLIILFNSYHQDESIKINPLRDFDIDETFNKAWLLPHKIERLARSFEFGIFRGFITAEQGTIIEKDFSGVRYQIDEIKKTYH